MKLFLCLAIRYLGISLGSQNLRWRRLYRLFIWFYYCCCFSCVWLCGSVTISRALVSDFSYIVIIVMVMFLLLLLLAINDSLDASAAVVGTRFYFPSVSQFVSQTMQRCQILLLEKEAQTSKLECASKWKCNYDRIKMYHNFVQNRFRAGFVEWTFLRKLS